MAEQFQVVGGTESFTISPDSTISQPMVCGCGAPEKDEANDRRRQYEGWERERKEAPRGAKG